jgi:predicted MPP superfamily phosphohydrolase
MKGRKPLATKVAVDAIKEFTGDNGITIRKTDLARVLCERHPELFESVENARTVIRYVTQSSGTTLKSHVKTTVEWKPLQLPEQEKNDYSKYVIDSKKIAILSDIHFPYADLKALDIALQYIFEWQPDCIILNGDTIDMYMMSNFCRDPRQRSVKYELDVTRSFLQQLRERFPDVKIVYKEGNHCERYQKKILERLPEIIELEWTKLEYALGLNQLNIDYVGNKRIIRAGHLNILHGNEFSKGFIAPVNVARGFYMKAKSNVIAGHHHRISEHFETDLAGKTIGAWSTGCLCELHPHYMPINSWQHGFATVDIVDNDGNFRVKNLKIMNGEIL